MTTEKRYFRIEHRPAGCVIQITEPYLSGDVVGEIIRIELLETIRKVGSSVVVVDMKPVKAISSSVIGALLLGYRTLLSQRGELRFSSVPDLVKDVFETMNLTGTRFRLYPDPESALATGLPELDSDEVLRMEGEDD